MGGVVGREVATYILKYVSSLASSRPDSRLMSLCT